MSYVLFVGPSRAAWKRLGLAMLTVGGIATALGFLGYAAALSYAAAFNIPGIEAAKIGTEVFFVTGALGVAGAFFYLAATG